MTLKDIIDINFIMQDISQMVGEQGQKIGIYFYKFKNNDFKNAKLIKIKKIPHMKILKMSKKMLLKRVKLF